LGSPSKLRCDHYDILLTNTIINKFGGGGEVLYFSVINFQGYSIRQLSCYTLPSECLLPWPSYCCFYEITPFMVSDEYNIGHFSHQLTVHPTLSVLLTKADPLKTVLYSIHVQLRNMNDKNKFLRIFIV